MYAVRLLLQAGYFLLLARWLGVHEFGLFSGVWVLAGFIATLSGLGFQVLVFRATALNPSEAASCVVRGLHMIAVTALPLVIVFIVVATWIFPKAPDFSVLLLLAVSEIALVPVLNLLSSMHQGHERLGRSHTILATLWGIRVAALMLLGWFHFATLPAIISMHALATATVAVVWLTRERHWFLSTQRARFAKSGELLAGFYYAMSGATIIAYTELNQSILLALTGAVAAGLFSIAYKIVALMCAPLAVLCQAISPRLVRLAHEGGEAFRRFAMAMAWPILAYAAVSALCIYFASRYLVIIFGPSYADAEQVVRQLCVLPLFMAVRLLAVYALMAMSNQKFRVIAELACLAAGLTLNFYLIHRHGLPGAIAAMLITEAMTATVLAWVAWYVSRISKPITVSSTP